MDDVSIKRSEDQDVTAPTWYFDLLSPFAYLALGAVERLARRREIVLRPVVLGAVLAHWGQRGPAEIPPKRVHTYRLCQFLADQARVPLRFPPRHPFRSLDALRLLAALGCPAEAVRTAFDFTWAEGRDPSDPAELAALGRLLGVDDPAAFIARHDAKTRLRAWTDQAIAAGVFGVPTLSVGGALFWGLDAMPMAEAALDDPGLLARGEMARLLDLPVGVSRT
jgi:2-hydroxychromene-2-carboxylate isomerase